MTAAGTLFGLEHRLGCEYAEDDGHEPIHIELGDSLAHSLADVVEVWRVAPYDAADGYDGIDLMLFAKVCAGISELECARYVLHDDILLSDAVFDQGLECSCKQGLGDIAIPFRYGNADAIVFTGGYAVVVVVRQVVKSCCHSFFLVLLCVVSEKRHPSQHETDAFPCMLLAECYYFAPLAFTRMMSASTVLASIEV